MTAIATTEPAAMTATMTRQALTVAEQVQQFELAQRMGKMYA